MQTHNKMLENQLAQMANALKGKHSTSLPSQGIDPREHANAIVTRSGKGLGEVQGKGMENDLEGEKSKEKIIESSSSPCEVRFEKVEKEKEKEKEETKSEIPLHVAKLSYPGRFAGSRLDEQFARFLEVLSKLYVNIPFTEAIKQMPTYAKFLKDILSNKRDVINIPENCSAIIQNKLPTKLKDPGSFSIPCAIGDMVIDRALCDLGASISLMPLSMCKRLGLGELKPTNISLQLADRSIKLPLGKLEDVPLRVGKLYIPVDFIVLDMDEDVNVPIILGRPFLATAGAIIDVKNGKLSLLVGKEKVEFKLNQVMKCPSNIDDYMRVDVVERVIHESIHMHLHNTNDPLEYVLTSKDRLCKESMEVKAIEEYLDSPPTIEKKEQLSLVIRKEKVEEEQQQQQQEQQQYGYHGYMGQGEQFLTFEQQLTNLQTGFDQLRTDFETVRKSNEDMTESFSSMRTSFESLRLELGDFRNAYRHFYPGSSSSHGGPNP